MYKGEIESILDADQQAGELPVIDCHCLQACISHLKYHKASGYDGITNEHIIYGGNNLLVHLCLLFNSLIKHCFVPAVLLCQNKSFGIIVPLLKSKHGDASQMYMYMNE